MRKPILYFIIGLALISLANAVTIVPAEYSDIIEFNITNHQGVALTNIPIYANFTYDSSMGNLSTLRIGDSNLLSLNISLDFNNSYEIGLWFSDPNMETGANIYTLYYGGISRSSNLNTRNVFGKSAVFIWHMTNITAEIGGDMNISGSDYSFYNSSLDLVDGTTFFNTTIPSLPTGKNNYTIVASYRLSRPSTNGMQVSWGQWSGANQQMCIRDASGSKYISGGQTGASADLEAGTYKVNNTYNIGVTKGIVKNDIRTRVMANYTSGVVYGANWAAEPIHNRLYIGGADKDGTDAWGANHTGMLYSVMIFNETFDNDTIDFIVQNFNISRNYYSPSTPSAQDYVMNYTNPSFNRSVESAFIDFKIVTNYTGSLTMYLNFNGTQYTTSRTSDGNIHTYTKRITTPKMVHLNDTLISDLNSNVSVFWNFSYPTGASSALDDWNHTIFKPMVHDCASLNTHNVLNVTINNEATRSLLFGNLSEVFNIYVNDSAITRTHNFTYEDVTSTGFCMYPSWMKAFNSQVYIDYTAAGYDNKTYELPLGSPLLLSNASNQTINLYLLSQALTSDIVLRVMDEDYDAMPDAIVTVERYFPELNTFFTIEVLRTGDDGRTLAHLVENTVDYRFTVQNSTGTRLKRTNRMKVICLTSPCELEFVAFDIEPFFQDFENIDGLEHNLYFDSVNRRFVGSWDDTGAGTGEMRLLVTQVNASGFPVICNYSSTALSGTFNCDIPTSVNGTFRAILFRTASPENPLEWLVETIDLAGRDIFGTGVMFWIILMVICLMFVGIWSPKVSIMLNLLTFICLWIFGIMNISMSLLWGLIIVSIIIISRLKV